MFRASVEVFVACWAYAGLNHVAFRVERRWANEDSGYSSLALLAKEEVRRFRETHLDLREGEASPMCLVAEQPRRRPGFLTGWWSKQVGRWKRRSR